jgi:hypothetical protein
VDGTGAGPEKAAGAYNVSRDTANVLQTKLEFGDFMACARKQNQASL